MTGTASGIVESIAAAAARAGDKARVERAVIGLGFTMVCLEGGACGLAYTLREELERGCEYFLRAGGLAGSRLEELLPWMVSAGPPASALGLAAANAVLAPPSPPTEPALLEALGLRPGERVVTVGRFRPLEPALLERRVRLEVIEPGDPPEPLRRCDVALITATSIINHTIDDLLSAVGPAREIVVLGPSTPCCPGAFSGTGVTLLAGSSVADAPRAWDVVCQGGGTVSLGRALRRWVARVREAE